MSTGAAGTLGKYIYKGFLTGRYEWTNVNSNVIWYNPTTGGMGDPNASYEGSDEKKGLNPTNCAAIPSIETIYTTAVFTPQQSLDPHPYTEPYDRFARKKETDEQVYDVANTITNTWPELYVGVDSPEPRRFSPLYQVTGDITAGSEEHTFT